MTTAQARAMMKKIKKGNVFPLMATKQYVKRTITSQMDDKHHPVSNSYSVSDAGTVVDISAIAQSAAQSTDLTRIGDDLTLKAIELRWQVRYDDTNNLVRIMIFQTKDTFSTAPEPSDVLRNLFGTVRAPLAPLYFDARSRFKVLYDRLVTVGDQSPRSVARKVMIYPKKLARKKIHFYGGSSTHKVGGIYLLMVSDSGGVSHPTVDFAGDIYFHG